MECRLRGAVPLCIKALGKGELRRHLSVASSGSDA